LTSGEYRHFPPTRNHSKRAKQSRQRVRYLLADNSLLVLSIVGTLRKPLRPDKGSPEIARFQRFFAEKIDRDCGGI